MKQDFVDLQERKDQMAQSQWKTNLKLLLYQIKNKMNKKEETKLKEKIIRAIKNVFDPEIPVDVYELGLIYEINILPINNIHILMTLTSPNCPAAETIPSDVKNKVKMIKEIDEVDVEITFDPPYSTDLMSEEAKLELGFI